jgi:hypothetical protein
VNVGLILYYCQNVIINETFVDLKDAISPHAVEDPLFRRLHQLRENFLCPKRRRIHHLLGVLKFQIDVNSEKLKRSILK